MHKGRESPFRYCIVIPLAEECPAISTQYIAENTYSGLQSCRWQYGSIFIRLAAVASHICEITRNPRKFELIVQCHPRSSILVPIESENFLLVINSNFW